jgi:glutaredoxin 3
MDIKIYTNQGCGYCGKAKELCKRAGLEYTEYRIGTDITKEEFRELFAPARGYPQFLIDDEKIGGLAEAVKFFVENKLITSKVK